VTLVELERGEGHDLAVVSLHARRVEEEEPEVPATPEATGEAEPGESD
jgi:hypothetical protein